jgi:vesicle coat complex subunit
MCYKAVLGREKLSNCEQAWCKSLLQGTTMTIANSTLALNMLMNGNRICFNRLSTIRLTKLSRKEAIQKTIMAMTLGKDVSQLFPDVLKNIATADLDQKKLVYLYLMCACSRT